MAKTQKQDDQSEDLLSQADEQIFNVMKALKLTPYALSKVCGYKTPQSVYNVIEKKAHFGLIAVAGIKAAYPNININHIFDPTAPMWIVDEEANKPSLDERISALEALIRDKND